MSGQPFSERVKALGLPLDELIVIASGVLDAYGIREADDIDIAVSPELFAALGESEAWNASTTEWGELYYRNGDCEAWSGWTEPQSDKPLYEDLLKDTEVIDGVRYMKLPYVREWKRKKGREKDRNDIILIDRYMETHHA